MPIRTNIINHNICYVRRRRPASNARAGDVDLLLLCRTFFFTVVKVLNNREMQRDKSEYHFLCLHTRGRWVVSRIYFPIHTVSAPFLFYKAVPV